MGIIRNLFSLSDLNTDNISLKRLIPKCKEWKKDTVYVSTSNRCPVCKQYNKKIYSLYGWNNKYNRLPNFLLQQKCPNCNCSIGFTLHTK